jgi:hypothetical protein
VSGSGPVVAASVVKNEAFGNMLYEDKYVSRSLNNLGPLFLKQGAAEPEHANKHPANPTRTPSP